MENVSSSYWDIILHMICQGKSSDTTLISSNKISKILTLDKDFVQKIVKLGVRKLLVLTRRTQTKMILQHEIRAMILM